jgi:hypothetical protein
MTCMLAGLTTHCLITSGVHAGSGLLPPRHGTMLRDTRRSALTHAAPFGVHSA